MRFRSTAPRRKVLTGLAVAGALAGSAGAASAQYYGYVDEDAYPRGYYERYAPRPPAQIPPRAVGRLAARSYGLVQVDRMVQTRSSYVIDGETASGRRTRLIVDAYSGDVLDSIPLPRAAAPRIARVDPRDDDRPAPRLVPRPPERPPSLKPPGQASAPATIQQPAPAMPRAPEPKPPAEKPPASASAPPTTAPPSPATPSSPTRGTVDPETGAAKPQLVNPSDVRGTGEPERTPPLAKAPEPAIGTEAQAGGEPTIRIAPVELPPVQIEDATPSRPRPETPAVPVTPLD